MFYFFTTVLLPFTTLLGGIQLYPDYKKRKGTECLSTIPEPTQQVHSRAREEGSDASVSWLESKLWTTLAPHLFNGDITETNKIHAACRICTSHTFSMGNRR